MERKYLVTYDYKGSQGETNSSYAWFDDKEELEDFIENSTVTKPGFEILEKLEIQNAKDLVEEE